MGRKTKNFDLPKYCRRVKTRHGKIVIQFSRFNRAPFIQIDAIPNTPEFYAIYSALLAGESIATKAAQIPNTPKLPSAIPNTFRWLCNRFIQYRYASTKRITGVIRDKRILDGYCLQPLKKDNPKRIFADLPLAKMKADHLNVLIQRTSEESGLAAANIAAETLQRMCRHAFKKDILPTDLSLKLEKYDHVEKHRPPWEQADFDKYEARHKNNPQALRVLAVLYHTGTAVVDAAKLGWANIHDDDQAKAWGAKVCRGIRQKTANNRRPGEFNMPVSQAFLDLMGLTPQKVVGIQTFIVNKWGKPYTGDGLSLAFADWCKQAGIEKRAHGIRAAAAIRMAMRGATTHELCWMFGWATLSEAERYTREADRRRGGAGAARLLEGAGVKG